MYYSSMDLPAPSSAVVKRASTAATAGAGGLSAGIAAQHPPVVVEVDYEALLTLLAQAHIPAQDLEFVRAFHLHALRCATSP